jgi:hypothetical protein
MVECAGLMEGEQRGVTWRAHEGKVTALHSRGSSENMLLSGGSDGTVRRWDLDKLPLDVSPRGQMRDLGLNVCEGAGEDNFVAQHDDSITQLAYYDQKVASASRDGARLASIKAPLPDAAAAPGEVTVQAIDQEPSGKAWPGLCEDVPEGVGVCKRPGTG